MKLYIFNLFIILIVVNVINACTKNDQNTLDGDLDSDENESSDILNDGVEEDTENESVLSENEADAEIHEQTTYLEQYRPQYHYSTLEGWMNDPNGLVYFEGKWHLFYQYAPEGFLFDFLHWGHTVSDDLIHWQHKKIAIYPSQKLGNAYSGSAIVDKENNSGLCVRQNGCILAFYTHAGGEDKTQKQSLAYSNDGGETFVEYENNPIIPNTGEQDFRDPKVFWYDIDQCWIMLIAAKDKIKFYSSTNLLQWQHLSDFNKPDTSGLTWECPDLFQLPVSNMENTYKWVLQVDVFGDGNNGGSAAQYYVGEFDGVNFIPDKNYNENTTVDWMDSAKDFYAAQSFSNAPDNFNSRTMFGWMNNWAYALMIPTDPFQGAMSLPRKITLQENNGKIILVQNPIDEIEKLRSDKICEFSNIIVDNDIVKIEELYGEQLLEVNLRIDNETATDFGISVLENGSNQTLIGYNTITSSVYLDRSNSGLTDFSNVFADNFEEELVLDNNSVIFRIFIDTSSIEVFVNDGMKVFTSLVFPLSTENTFSIYSYQGKVNVREVEIYRLKSVW